MNKRDDASRSTCQSAANEGASISMLQSAKMNKTARSISQSAELKRISRLLLQSAYCWRKEWTKAARWVHLLKKCFWRNAKVNKVVGWVHLLKKRTQAYKSGLKLFLIWLQGRTIPSKVPFNSTVETLVSLRRPHRLLVQLLWRLWWRWWGFLPPWGLWRYQIRSVILDEKDRIPQSTPENTLERK